MKTLIVIPAMNEQDTIGNVIDDIRGHCDHDILVVNDGSHDKTADIVRTKNCRLLNHAINLGAWKSIQTGIRFALKNHYDAVVTMDADGQHRASDVRSLLLKKHHGFDFVIGSCPERGTISRQMAWQFFRLITGLKIKDLTSGYRVYSKPLMVALAGKRASLYDFQDVGVLLIAKHLGMRIVEEAVTMEKRQHGMSKIFDSWWAVFNYLIYTSILTFSKSLLFFRENDKKALMKEGVND